MDNNVRTMGYLYVKVHTDGFNFSAKLHIVIEQDLLYPPLVGIGCYATIQSEN